jgi:hypothetical protein
MAATVRGAVRELLEQTIATMEALLGSLTTTPRPRRMTRGPRPIARATLALVLLQPSTAGCQARVGREDRILLHVARPGPAAEGAFVRLTRQTQEIDQ